MKTTEQSPAAPHKYMRLATQFREQIHSGILKPGDRLPSFAQMQAQHGVGQGTLERAYALLEEEHLIVREPKRGTFVAEVRHRPAQGVVGVWFGRNTDGTPFYRHLLESSPYYRQILDGVQQVASEKKIEILLLQELSASRLARVDAAISMGEVVPVPPTIPFVTLVSSTEAGPSVTADDFGGAATATRHLIALGHSRIAYLVLNGRGRIDPVTAARLAGYRHALQEAGIAQEPALIQSLHNGGEEAMPFVELGYLKMRQWLQTDWAELGCTAILANNDHTAIGMMRAFEEAGINVPGDVSVVGFDGTEIADHVKPPLTTVVVPLHEIGAEGMRLALEQISGSFNTQNGQTPTRRVLPTELKIQGTTAPRKA